jgi:cholesterol transport system auxiliary component
MVASCGSILPKPSPPPSLYRLTPLDAPRASSPAADTQLIVDVPSAAASLDTDRIALARGTLGFDYLAGAAWADRAPVLVQSLVVESLENAGLIRVVARPSGELRPDAILTTDLRRFEARYGAGDRPEARISLECRLVRMPDRVVLSLRTFEGRAEATANETAQIVAAFDEAMHAVLRELVPWAAQSVAARR